MKRLLLLAALLAALVAFAPAASADPYYCDGGGIQLIEDANACGTTGYSWWHYPGGDVGSYGYNTWQRCYVPWTMIFGPSGLHICR